MGYLGPSTANSYTAESVFLDEPIAQKIVVQELTTPETLKLDLLIQTKTLSEKVNKRKNVALRSHLSAFIDESISYIDGRESTEFSGAATSVREYQG